MSKTNYAEVDLLKVHTGQAADLGPAVAITPYVVAFTVAPAEGTDGTAASFTGLSAAGKFAAPVAGAPSSVTSNAAIGPFAASTGETIVALGLATAANFPTTGELLRFETLGSPIVLAADDQLNLPSGTVVFTED
jgi:hypothetical protein